MKNLKCPYCKSKERLLHSSGVLKPEPTTTSMRCMDCGGDFYYNHILEMSCEPTDTMDDVDWSESAKTVAEKVDDQIIEMMNERPSSKRF